MKKFLQKSCAWLVMLVAWFAVSMSAMAQTTTFDYMSDCTETYTGYTRNGITTSFGAYWTGYGCDLWGGGTVTFQCAAEKIVKIELDITNHQGNFTLKQGEGSFEVNGSVFTWTGSANVVEIGSGVSDDIAFSTARVWLESDMVPFTPVDYTVTYPDGVNVSILGQAVSGGTYHATEKFSENNVDVTNVPDGYKAVVSVDHENLTVTVTLEEILPAKVTSVYPTSGEIRLDNDEDGIHNIHLVFEGRFDKAVYAGDGFPVPAGVTLTKDGTTPITINPSYGFTMWQGSTECYVNTTPYSLTEPGTYVLHIPAGINTIDGRPTEEVNVTWTVVAASTFKLDSYSVEALGEKWDNTYMKTLTGLSVTLPSDATFKEFSAEKAVELRDQEGEYSPVDATWAENDGVVTITFATPITGVDANLNYRIAEGSIVLTDGRYNKAVTKSVSVSEVFVFNATSTTPQNWTNLGNNQLDENFEFTFVYPVEIDDVDITKFAFTQPAIQLSTSVVDYTVNGNTLTFKFKKAWLDANYDSTFGTMYDWNSVYLHVAEKAVLDADLNYNQEASYMYYWRVYPTFTMNDSEWCTYSSSSCFVVPAGYTAYYVSGFEGESVVLTKIGDAGKTLYYYNGYLLHGPAGKVAYETGNYWDAVSPNGNYLVSNPDYTNTYYASNIAGAYWDYQIDTPIESCKLYQLSYDNNGENLGFYTQTGTNGESIEVAADKAFLFVPERAAGSIKRFVLEDGTVVTGLTAVEVPMEKDAIYNLQGQRVNATEKGGVYVKNGKKFIVK